MFHNPQKTSSFWQELEPPIFPPLQQDQHTDVCIVGAGIVGAMTAYLLLKHGHQVVLVDKETFGENETGRTSAHLASVMDEGFQELIRLHGVKGARKAYQSHADAISLIQKIVNEEGIDCDFRRIEGYLFLDESTDKDYLEKEMEALRKIGFPGAELVASAPQFPEWGPAIRYPDQARIHPLKYLHGLWRAILSMGGEIYTLTKVKEITGGERPVVTTTTGARIYANNVMVCANTAINDRVTMHLKEAAYRSYVVGTEVPKDSFPDVLMWDTKDPYHYIRVIKDTREGYDTVIVGGEDHRVGQEDETEARFAELETWVKHRLGLYTPITMKWSGQIIEPADGLAYIGQSPGEDHVYICSGDSGQGLTHSGVAAMIFRDLLAGTPNEWLSLYSPQRVNWKAAGELIRENSNTLAQYSDLLYLNKEAAKAKLRPGEGTLTRHGMEPVALYCDENNQIHSLSAICPHLGGVVHWNEAEKTWDCPCHGSRFACTGEVLNGPAIADLSPATHLPSDNIQEYSDEQLAMNADPSPAVPPPLDDNPRAENIR